MTVAHTMALAMLIWMLIALFAFLLMSVWTDDPEHRAAYLRWAVAYLTALIVLIAVLNFEGDLWPFSSSS